TIVMVTHDPNAASYADRVIFLSDGHIVDEMHNPTPETVLDQLKKLDVLAGAAAHPDGAGQAPSGDAGAGSDTAVTGER
ncbi:MAG TPA: hypothetical protein VFR67_21730, partial [Pilimelia sp.]|nr:hypothetical protein [Pilimelia sp.]